MVVVLGLRIATTALLLLLGAPADSTRVAAEQQNPAPREPTEPSASALLEKAIEAYSRGDKALAVREARAAVAKDAGYAHAHNFLGVVCHDIGDTAQALRAYETSTALAPGYAGAWSNLGLLLRQIGKVRRSRSAFERSIELDPSAAIAHNGLGLALHYSGDPEGAIPHYDTALALDPRFAEALYNRGVSQMHAGAVQAAAQSYFQALEIQPDYVEAMINLASVHHRHGSLDMAREYYTMALRVPDAAVDDKIMVHTNLGVTYVMDYDGDRALAHFAGARALLQGQREVLLGEARAESAAAAAAAPESSPLLSPSHSSSVSHKNSTARAAWKHQDVTLASIDTELRANAAHFSRTRTAQCDWELYWPRLFEMFAGCDAEMALGRESSLLPFDTLLLPTPSSAWTLRVARSHSIKWEDAEKYAPLALDLTPLMSPGDAVERSADKTVPAATANTEDDAAAHRLRIGYISHDFNDHPTAHMAEGLFVHHDASRYAVSAYSYGKDDESVFRSRIEGAVETFVEMSTNTFMESAQRIRDDRVHVLYDLQCHTRGNRIEIAAVKPAPILVNFLIYPGPMGATWIDYTVADAVVAPAEHARQSYLSKLLIMPATYQVNYYPREDYVRVNGFAAEDERGVGDTASPLPKRAAVDPRFENAADMDVDDVCEACAAASFVFCNFNKNDKLDPESFAAWMNVLRAVPGSILWMLAPSRAAGNGAAILRNLRREAAARGVAPSRLVFAPRRTKRAHLERMRHADLFLDSFVYGAHSTATDALRGGLPVLTVRGDNFAGRVATSLLLNVGLPEIGTASVKVYERVAVMLARGALQKQSHEQGGTDGDDGVGRKRRRRGKSGLRRRLILSGLRKGRAEVSGVLGELARRITRRRRIAPQSASSPPLGVQVSKKDAGALLHVEDGGLPLFHIAHYTRTFERGAECMHEVRTAKCGGDVERGVCSMHVVVGAKGLRTMTVEHGWDGGEGIIAKHEKRAAPKIAGEITAFEGTGKMELRTI